MILVLSAYWPIFVLASFREFHILFDVMHGKENAIQDFFDGSLVFASALLLLAAA